jgi:hypothetical protein
MAAITIAYSEHRPEALPYTAAAMRRHQVVFLEEAPDPGFGAMLDGRMGIDDYVAGLETEYPEFSRLACRMLRELKAEGLRFEQVDPFVERLLQIHQLFADGRPPAEVQRRPTLKPVYTAEREATRTLIDYYAAAARLPFTSVLSALKSFARADARRFRLRDRMRAEALARMSAGYRTCYVEAGPMHLWLRRELVRRCPAPHTVRTLFPMAPAVKAVAGRSVLMGPGDVLTARYLFNPGVDSARTDLLAARSLIYNKLIVKTEMVSPSDDSPHTLDEWRVLQLTNRLRMADCAALFPLLRSADRARSNAIVLRHLETRPQQ